MNSSSALRRVRAWHEGRPLETTEALPWPRPRRDDTLIVAFVRMAGESVPWGFAVGAPGATPRVVTVPEPRDRDLLAALALELAPSLLAHLPHPAFANAPDASAPPAAFARRQLWVPGATHVEMLHFLDYRFARATKAAPDAVTLLNALGRAAGWLFRESTRPGQVRVFDATARLREVFAFPADDLRQQHLGFLMAWLETDGDRAARAAAADDAERATVGVTLDPALERDVLAPLVERWHDARARGSEHEAAVVAADIDAALRPELLRRWSLVETAFDALDRDARPTNPGTDALVAAGADEFAWQYWRNEVADEDTGRAEPFTTDAETDRFPAAASARYFAHVHAAELSFASLVHGDAALAREAIEDGDAFAGTISAVVDVSPTRAVRPVWTVRASSEHPLRLREGAKVCVVGAPGRVGEVLAIETTGASRTFTVEITGWKTARRQDGIPAADDETALVGTDVVFVAAEVTGLTRRKAARVWDREGPGAWLTHGVQVPAERTVRAADPQDLVALVERLGGA